MSTRRLWLFLAVVLPVLAALAADLPSVDLAYHLRAGDEILATRAIPAMDTWTFSATGTAWVDQNWAAQVVLAIVEGAAGWTGLSLLRAALVGATFLCLLFACRAPGLADRTAALLTIGAFVVSSFTLALRPQLFGIALFAGLLLLTQLRREHPRWLWLAVPVIVVWANVHGSFVIGIGWLGLTWLADLRRGAPSSHLPLAVGAAAALAATLNPAGIGVWRYAAGIATSPTISSRITEWQPPDVRSAEGLLFYGSALAVAAALARRGRAAPWASLIALAVFFLLGVLAVRGLAWWPPVAAVTIAALVATPSGAAPRRSEPVLVRRVNAALAAVLIIVGVTLLPLWRPVDRGLGTPAGLVSIAPSGITARLREIAGPNDRLFAPQPWGSWFEYALPATPVFVDSRIELFGQAIWDEYDLIVEGGDGWREALDRRAVTIVVAVDRLGRDPLAGRLAADPAWDEVHADPDGRIFVRGR